LRCTRFKYISMVLVRLKHSKSHHHRESVDKLGTVEINGEKNSLSSLRCLLLVLHRVHLPSHWLPQYFSFLSPKTSNHIIPRGSFPVGRYFVPRCSACSHAASAWAPPVVRDYHRATPTTSTVLGDRSPASTTWFYLPSQRVLFPLWSVRHDLHRARQGCVCFSRCWDVSCGVPRNLCPRACPPSGCGRSRWFGIDLWGS